MSKKTKIYRDILPVLDGDGTVYSSAYETKSRDGEVFLLSEIDIQAGNVTLTIEHGDKVFTAASATASDALATGEVFSLQFKGNGFVDYSNNRNVLEDLGAITVTIGADATLAGLNALLGTIQVATTGQYKGFYLSNWFEFTSTTTIALKSAYAAQDMGFYLANTDAEFTSGNYFGSDYSWTTATAGSAISASENNYLSATNVKDYIRVKAVKAGTFDTDGCQVDLVFASRNSNVSDLVLEVKHEDDLLAGVDMGNSETKYSDAIEVGKFNKSVYASFAKSDATVNVATYIETTFGAETTYEIDNNDLNETSGESSSHTSYIEDLSTAEWFVIKTGALTADGVTNTLEATAGIGKWVRVKLVADGTGDTTDLVISLRMEG
jgi:hypothetical protein